MQQPDPGAAEHVALGRERRAAVDPGLEYAPPITNPEIWYSYRDNQGAPNGPLGTPCFATYGPGAPVAGADRSACVRSSSPSSSPAESACTARRRTTTTR